MLRGFTTYEGGARCEYIAAYLALYSYPHFPTLYNPTLYNPTLYNPTLYNPILYNPILYNPTLYK